MIRASLLRSPLQTSLRIVNHRLRLHQMAGTHRANRTNNHNPVGLGMPGARKLISLGCYRCDFRLCLKVTPLGTVRSDSSART